MLKELVKQFLGSLGYKVSRGIKPAAPGTVDRPVGNMRMFLEDLHTRSISPSSILDVGANIGGWSRVAKAVFPTANCFLIEPQIEMKFALDKFCQEFPGSKWFLAGAGATPGDLTLSIWDDQLGSSFLPPESEELKQVVEQRRLPIITIDSLIERDEIPLPQLVKLDIQGFELEALRGGSKLFGNTEVFILEVSLFRFKKQLPIFHEVIDFMASRGYFVYDFSGFLRRPYDGALGQVDICFAKQDGLLRIHDYWSCP